MSKQGFAAIVLVAIVAGILILGGVGYFVLRAPKVAPEQTQETPQAVTPPPAASSTPTPTSSGSVTQKTTLKSLLALSQPQKCTYAGLDKNTGINISATVYVANGKVREDFVLVTSEGTQHNHAIMANNVSYVWMDEVHAGVKTAVTNIEKSTGDQAINFEKEVDYKCESWLATNATFEVPTNIRFIEAPPNR
jgi:hypothetical protein